MHALVLGAGAVGVATAWYLRENGWDVTVLDRRAEAASETSFANAGIVAASYATPWAAPGTIGKALAGLFRAHPPLILRLRADRALGRWLWRFRAQCTAEAFLANKARMQRIARYSAATLKALSAATGISYAARPGYLQLFRTEAEMDAARPALALLDQARVPYRLVDAGGCDAIEPGLARRRHALAGGLYLEADEVGDCRSFTRALAGRAAERGVRFLWNTKMVGIEAEPGRIRAVQTSAGTERADAYVVALASESRRWLAPLGLGVPVYPVKGFSLSAPIRNDAAAPRAGLMDERHKVALARIGDTLRIAGTAELAGFDASIPEARKRTLRHVAESWFPEAADLTAAEYWTGFRPMTPDGPPILGATPLANLYLNIGQGSQGWTQAWGSGKAVADLIAGRKPDIGLAEYAWSRFR